MQDQHLSAEARAIIAVVRESKEDTHKQIASVRDAQRSLKEEVQRIAKGFPDEDPDSHRRYHETVIEWRELRNKMVREALVNAAKVGGVAGLGWVVYALWTAAKMEMMK